MSILEAILVLAMSMLARMIFKSTDFIQNYLFRKDNFSGKMDLPNYFDLVPRDLQKKTLLYKAKAEEIDRNVNFLLELHEIFFENESTEIDTVFEILNQANQILKNFKVKARWELDKESDWRYVEVYYSFNLTYFENEFYSDQLLKALIVFFFSREELPLPFSKNLDLKTRREFAITGINDYARNSSSPIRVAAGSDLIEVVSICESQK